MEVIKESKDRKIRLISFGKHGHQRTAQVVVINAGLNGKRASYTYHLHYKNGTWLYIETAMENGKAVQRGYEFVADCLPKKQRSSETVA